MISAEILPKEAKTWSKCQSIRLRMCLNAKTQWTQKLQAASSTWPWVKGSLVKHMQNLEPCLEEVWFSWVYFPLKISGPVIFTAPND